MPTTKRDLGGAGSSCQLMPHLQHWTDPVPGAHGVPTRAARATRTFRSTPRRADRDTMTRRARRRARAQLEAGLGHAGHRLGHGDGAGAASATRRRAAHAPTTSPTRRLAGYARGVMDGPRRATGRRPRPRHATPTHLHVSPLFACLGALSLVVAGAAVGSLTTGGALAATVADPGNGGGHVSIMNSMARAFANSSTPVALPPPRRRRRRRRPHWPAPRPSGHMRSSGSRRTGRCRARRGSTSPA